MVGPAPGFASVFHIHLEDFIESPAEARERQGQWTRVPGEVVPEAAPRQRGEFWAALTRGNFSLRGLRLPAPGRWLVALDVLTTTGEGSGWSVVSVGTEATQGSGEQPPAGSWPVAEDARPAISNAQTAEFFYTTVPLLPGDKLWGGADASASGPVAIVETEHRYDTVAAAVQALHDSGGQLPLYSVKLTMPDANLRPRSIDPRGKMVHISVQRVSLNGAGSGIV